MALTLYEMKEFKEAVNYLDIIIQRAYDKFPALKSVTEENQMFERDKTVATGILRESAIVEALNLKASILYQQED